MWGRGVVVFRIRHGRPPFAAVAARRPAAHVDHCSFVADQQPQQLGERRAVEAARRSIGSGVDGEPRGDARDGDGGLTAQLAAEHASRRGAGGGVTESARRPRRQAAHQRQLLRGMASGPTPGVREDQIGVRAATDQPQQRLDVRRLHPGAAARQGVVLGQLHRNGARQPQPLRQQLLGELRKPVFHGRVEIANGFE